MSTYFDENMSTCLNALMLICSDTFMIESYYVNMLCWSHAMMIECFHVYVLWWSHAWKLWWLPTPVLKCVTNSMLTCIDIHMFDIHTHVHTLGWWNVYWLEGKNDCIVGRFNTQMSWWLCLNVEMIGRLQVCVFGCFNAYMHICSHDHMVVCSQALLITYSHLTLLWW